MIACTFARCGFPSRGAQVALGEVAVLGILGLPLMRLLPRNPKFREIICSYQKE